MFNNGNSTTAFVISAIALVHGSFACVTSMIMFIVILYHLHNDRLKRENKLVLLLCANNYLLIFLYTVGLILFNVHSILGDLYGLNFNSSWCRFQGYYVSATLCALYNSFIVQAFYRLCRIVYSSYRWLQLFWVYVLLIPVQIFLSFILLCPLLFWNDVIYLFNEHYCYVSFENVRGILWTAFTNYNIPLTCLSFIYFRIGKFVRHQSNNQTRLIKRRQTRDLLVIRRIITLVGLLVTLGVPSMIFVLMFYITGTEHPLIYRVSYLSTDVSMAVLSLLIIFLTPQLKNIILTRWQRNRIIPLVTNLGNSIQLNAIYSAQ